ncbi:MAG: hypothetical protein AAGF84_03840 [Planctomycetota bacterium]
MPPTAPVQPEPAHSPAPVTRSSMPYEPPMPAQPAGAAVREPHPITPEGPDR